MNPDDLIDKGIIRETDLEGGPPGSEAADLGPFGRYMLLEELGRGGAGIVFRALDPLLNRELALKRLRFGDFELEARFLREAELLARLSHPGIMPVFDFGRESDALYFTMPLSTGLSLDRWIVERRHDARESARIVRQAAEALAHAHEQGVLHRDVKPANILVSAEGNAVVADFGLGRVVDPKGREAGRMTMSGEVMGTPSYMAPEFASGDLKGVDARCDVYGLGATLYEAMTGRPPFIGKSSLEILKRVTSEEPVPPRQLAPDAPADLEIICLKALEKDPARRYATARELADDLGRFLAGEPIRARRASPLYRWRRFAARRRAVVAVTISALCVIAAILGVVFWKAHAASARRLRIEGYLVSAGLHLNQMDSLLGTRRDEDSGVKFQNKLAFDWIAKALEEEADNALAYFLRGRIHALRLEKDEARRNYSIAIEKGPIPRAHLERAHLDCQDLVALAAEIPSESKRTRLTALKGGIHKDLESAIALKLDPLDSEFAGALLAFSELTPRGYAEAVKRLDDYVARMPDWRAFYWKGIAESLLSQYDKSLESLERALHHRQNCRAGALILNRLGMMLSDLGYQKSDLGMQRQAADKFRLASELDRTSPDPPLHLASVLSYLGDADQAIHWSEVALERAPGSVKAHAVRAQAYIQKHGNDRAADRNLLLKAKESLEIARPAFSLDSEQGRTLQTAWDYVVKLLAE